MTDDDVRDLQHREAIRELYARYCFYVDLGRPDLFADAFTPDGVLWLSDRGSFRGRDEIRAHVERRTGRLLHLIHNVAIQHIEEPRACSHAYFQLIEPSDATCAAYGMYDDVLLYADGRWYWDRKKTIYHYQSAPYQQGVQRRSDFGQDLEGVPSFIDNLERG